MADFFHFLLDSFPSAGVIVFLVAREPIIQGRQITAEVLAWIVGWLAEHPTGNRTRLSRELCVLWNWRNGAGRLKDMACRTLLLKLERRGQIALPPRRTASVNGRRNCHPEEIALNETPIQCDLPELESLKLQPVAPGGPQARLIQWLLYRYHYLGHRNGVGENLQYLAVARDDRPLACLVFGSAAWKAQGRDRFIGWNVPQRERNLGLMTNNTRFLIVPWARVRGLASHLLAQVCGRLSADWQAKYGHRIELVETFVEKDRFAGTAYRAAGWIPVGATRGRSRQDRRRTLSVPLKAVYLKPLSRDFRRRLCA